MTIKARIINKREKIFIFKDNKSNFAPVMRDQTNVRSEMNAIDINGRLLKKSLISNPDFVIKSKIRAIDREVKERSKRRILSSTISNQERMLLKN